MMCLRRSRPKSSTPDTWQRLSGRADWPRQCLNDPERVCVCVFDGERVCVCLTENECVCVFDRERVCVCV